MDLQLRCGCTCTRGVWTTYCDEMKHLQAANLAAAEECAGTPVYDEVWDKFNDAMRAFWEHLNGQAR